MRIHAARLALHTTWTKLNIKVLKNREGFLVFYVIIIVKFQKVFRKKDISPVKITLWLSAMSILTKELKEVSPNWVAQMVLTYCQTFSKPFQFRIWTKVSIGLKHTYIQGCLLTVPPNFQYQNEKRWAANQRFRSMKFSMYKRSSLVEQRFF